MRSIVLWIINLSSFAFAFIFGVTWFSRLRLKYNEEGNYFDPNSLVIYDRDAFLVYGALTLLFILVGAISWIYTAKANKTKPKKLNTDIKAE
ncbi:hypothetical protein TH63_13850 [Rufibacter radiotolerans]|uniref:Uncharacterized protein n=1 Tax=Rufibacter radiotolerans TaxID=1379910 RepID=A0A0H4W7N9_9BACT|nr:hypothetical protein [Rufibacter radiotolerans]AKQ46461.1 hypothetical protein TH63_13850 [Rufibacter radiotolerans]